MLQRLTELHSICFPHKPWTADDFMDLKKSGCEIIASDNAFIVWRQILDEAEIITIGVNPEIRKTGTAIALMEIATGEILKKSGRKIFLEVAENNTPAIKLYEKLGFVKIGIRPKYYDGVDAILMEKNLIV